MLSTLTRPALAQVEFEHEELSIVACGGACLSFAELARIPKEPPVGLPRTLSPQLLKHSDEQTLASLVAVSQAINQAQLTDKDFANWAIISTSRNLGRSAFATVIDKYRDEGPW